MLRLGHEKLYEKAQIMFLNFISTEKAQKNYNSHSFTLTIKYFARLRQEMKLH